MVDVSATLVQIFILLPDESCSGRSLCAPGLYLVLLWDGAHMPFMLGIVLQLLGFLTSSAKFFLLIVAIIHMTIHVALG